MIVAISCCVVQHVPTWNSDGCVLQNNWSSPMYTQIEDSMKNLDLHTKEVPKPVLPCESLASLSQILSFAALFYFSFIFRVCSFCVFAFLRVHTSTYFYFRICADQIQWKCIHLLALLCVNTVRLCRESTQFVFFYCCVSCASKFLPYNFGTHVWIFRYGV